MIHNGFYRTKIHDRNTMYTMNKADYNVDCWLNNSQYKTLSEFNTFNQCVKLDKF